MKYWHQDLNAWLGHAEVIYHKENKVWIYLNGNVQKVVAVKVKPYELLSKEEYKVIEKNVVNETEAIDENEIDIIEV